MTFRIAKLAMLTYIVIPFQASLTYEQCVNFTSFYRGDNLRLKVKIIEKMSTIHS